MTKQAPKHLVSHHSRSTLHNLHNDHQHLYSLSSPKAISSVPLHSWWPRSLGSQRLQLAGRPYSTLTHIDSQGKAHMVDVSAKQSTTREATACATVIVGPTIAQLIHANNIKKGDVLSISQIAGIMGAKRTSELIPLCHNIVLSTVKVEAELQRDLNAVQLSATVRCCGQTGVEMEALTAVSIAALTVYDMCKAVSHDITITNVRLMAKSGGKRDFQRAEGEEAVV